MMASTAPRKSSVHDLKVAEPGQPPRLVDRYDAPSLLGNNGRGLGRFHCLIKPVGSACNLKCSYCFYLGKESLPDGPGKGRMSEKVLEEVIAQYIGGVSGNEVVFSWQGGEPTLMGLEFFRKAVALQRKHARPGLRVDNDLQTNGTLLDGAWCEFLKQNRFLVGLSIDGPREVHDCYRSTRGGQPTFDAVVNAARLLRQHGVPFNTLTCIHHLNARRPLDVYRFLRRELDSRYIQFIPIVEPQGFERTAPKQWPAKAKTSNGGAPIDADFAEPTLTEWSVKPEDWGYFLCKTFDEWLNRDYGKVYVNHFESLVSQQLGLGSQVCVYGEICGKAVAVEHDGSVYACDHYVYPQYRLGNVQDAPLEQMVFCRGQVQFGYGKSESLPQYCRQCPFLNDCWGECPKNRILRAPGGEPGLNYLCAGFKRYFAHALPHVKRIARRLQEQGYQPLRRR